MVYLYSQYACYVCDILHLFCIYACNSVVAFILQLFQVLWMFSQMLKHL